MRLNNEFILKQRPSFKLFTKEQLDKIHRGAVEVLERTGVEVVSEEAKDILAGAGAKVSGNRVRIPDYLIEESLRTAGKKLVVYNRNGDRALFLEGDNVYFGPGSETPYTIDIDSGKRRQAVKKDVINAARVVDSLSNIDFVMSFALASDTGEKVADHHHFDAMVKNTTKPILYTAWDVGGLETIFEIAKVAAGGEETLKEKPFMLQYIEPISPLKHPKRDTTDKLFYCVDNDLPAMYVPSPSIGGTSPVTPAGGFVLNTADYLVGLVLSQIRKPGYTLVYGGGPTTLDMKTSNFCYGAPETFLGRAIRKEIAAYYGIPVFSTGGCTDAKEVDTQAGAEAANSLLMSALSGANLIHDVGYMDSGMTSSLQFLTICNDIIGSVKRMLNNIEVSEETLAIDLIDKVGPGGTFLNTRHTVDQFRERVWAPDIMERDSYDGWMDRGSKSIKEKATEKVKGILKNKKPNVLDEDKVKEINEIVDKADQQRG